MRLTRSAATLAVVTFVGGVVAQDLPAQELPARCTDLSRPDRGGHFIALADLARPRSSLDGDERLTLVDRSPEGALPPAYAPTDLVDLATMRATRAWRCTSPARQCLRRESALALRGLTRAMRQAGLHPYVSSAFRGYRVQCSTFGHWTRRDGFCEAAEASAVPGHSQHQLGTTLDLFTHEWTRGGDKFRAGYGCSEGGRWIAEHAHEHGFVLPYPLHPDLQVSGRACPHDAAAEARMDPRTGYRYEPWHLRYVGVQAASEFRGAWRESGPGGATEITFDQWLRARIGAASAVGAPVCDGCNCDRCATFARSGPCEQPAWTLGPEGARGPMTAEPQLVGFSLVREGERVVLRAQIEVQPNTATQGPIVTAASEAYYRRGAREVILRSGQRRAYPALRGAYRLAIGFGQGQSWPWSAALVGADRGGVENGFNAVIPATPGRLTISVPMLGVTPGTYVRLRIAGSGESIAVGGIAP